MLPRGVDFLIGLCRRSGHLAAGHWQVETALREGKAQVVLVAEDAGGSALRRHRKPARDRGVPLYVVGSQEELGKAAGLDPKAALAVTSPGLGKRVEEALREGAIRPLDPGGEAAKARRNRGDPRGT